MTETPETPAAPADADALVDVTDSDADTEQDDTGKKPAKANKDAARYRTQLRATETERDTLKAALATYQESAATSALADVMANPSDLFLVKPLADFLDDAGQLDVEGLKAAATDAVAARPHWAPPPPKFPDLNQGVRTSVDHSEPTWSDALKG